MHISYRCLGHMCVPLCWPTHYIVGATGSANAITCGTTVKDTRASSAEGSKGSCSWHRRSAECRQACTPESSAA